ncbi:MAG: MoaD/ThiS family protein [bacterium]
MDVEVKFFATVEEATGTNEDSFEQESPEPLGNLIERIVERYPDMNEHIDHCTIAINLETVNIDEATVKPGDEVAIMPPFGGGNKL